MNRSVWGSVAVVAVAILALSGAGDAAAGSTFAAALKPNRAIFPGETAARGTAKFWLSDDGRTLRYQVDAFDVGTVSQIHIHLGAVATTPEGEHYHLPPEEDHGETVGFLLNFSPESHVGNGTVAEGVLTAADLIGSLKGQPLKVLLDHMARGWAYVNVHVVQDYGQGRRFCCPTGVRGAIRPD